MNRRAAELAALRLPVVMTIGNRAIGGPINIWNDQSDSMALRDAGIAKFNLIKVSSIFPPNCKVISRLAGLKKLSPGQMVPCVMSENRTNEARRLVAASIGLAQFRKLPTMNARRSQIIRKYLHGIENIAGIQPLLPFEPENYVYQMFGIRAEKRDELMIYLKSMETPKVPMDSLAGLIRPSILKLKAQDPRKYLQTQSSLTNAGTANNAGTYPTPVEITISATGATSTSLTITNSTRNESIYVTTALSNGDSLVIDTRLHSVKLNGTERRDYLGNNSKWMLLDPGNNTISLSNNSNCTITTKWYSAWSL